MTHLNKYITLHGGNGVLRPLFFIQSIGGSEVVMQEDVSGVCINMVGLVLACSVFLVAQLVIIVAWTAVWHRRRRSKLEEPLSPATTTESLRQLYDSGYPRRI